MADDFTKTVRIQRPSRVAPDERGRNVWVGRVEEVELELMSTAALELILKSGDTKARSEIEKLAAGRKDGILARDTGTGLFQIVTHDELRNARDVTPPAKGAGNAELKFASTQILRRSLKPAGKDKGGGFDPYDSG